MIETRRAALADVDAIVAVGQATWRATYVPLVGAAYVEEFLARWWTAASVRAAVDEHRVWVGCLEGHVAAMASYGRDGGVLELHRLYVLPAAQGQDMGRSLLEAVIDSEQPHVDRVVLAYLDGNEGARRFYAGLGFTETHRDADAHGGPDDVWMARPV